MTLQYLRKTRVKFGGGGSMTINPSGRVEIRDEMKVRFFITKEMSGAENTAEISIYNLSESHRNSVGKELDNIEVEAGYAPPDGSSNVATIFKGQIRDVEHVRDGMDIITTIRCGDGNKALRSALISKSFKAGTPVKDVIEEVSNQLEAQGLTRGEWKLPDGLPKFIRPYAACGPCSREMDRLGRGFGFYWNSNDEKIEIVASDKALSQMTVISPQTGMIGPPTITDNGVIVKALLNPTVRVNHKVKIESETLEMNAAEGEYRVSGLQFVGDNKEGEFVVNIQGEAIKGGKVDEGEKP